MSVHLFINGRNEKSGQLFVKTGVSSEVSWPAIVLLKMSMTRLKILPLRLVMVWKSLV